MRQKSRNAQCAAMQAQNTSSRAQVAVAPSPQQDPAGFLRHLYEVAVRNALPIEGLARHLPKPPKGRTLVLGAGKAGGFQRATGIGQRQVLDQGMMASQGLGDIAQVANAGRACGQMLDQYVQHATAGQRHAGG